VESESLPQDAEQIGHVWAKSNRDGSPDRRFRDNYQIPLMRYGEMSLRSKTGLNEVYMVSAWQALAAFRQALRRYTTALPRAQEAKDDGSREVPYEAVADLDIPSLPETPSLHTVGSTLRFGAVGLVLAAICSVALSNWKPATEHGNAPEPGAAATTAPVVPEAAPLPTIGDTVKTPAAEPAQPAIPSGATSGSRLTRDEAIDLQMRLVALGYKPGPIDGSPGKQTIDAFNEWRVHNGRPPLKTIDESAYRDFIQTAK
jgi:hypothetical protein